MIKFKIYKLINLWLAIFIFNSIPVTAQENENIADSLEYKEKRNEIGFNILPFLSSFYSDRGGKSYGTFFPKFALTYKRYYKKGATRFQFNFTPNYYQKLYGGVKNYNSILYETDTTETWLYKNYNSNNLGINIGFEFINQKKYAQRFYGADLIFGINMIDFSNSIIVWEKVVYHPMDITRKYIEEILFSHKNSIIYVVGINPFYGWKYIISKKFLISVQFGLILVYSFGYDIISDDNYILKKQYFSEPAFLHETSLLNDVSIIFRF